MPGEFIIIKHWLHPDKCHCLCYKNFKMPCFAYTSWLKPFTEKLTSYLSFRLLTAAKCLGEMFALFDAFTFEPNTASIWTMSAFPFWRNRTEKDILNESSLKKQMSRRRMQSWRTMEKIRYTKTSQQNPIFNWSTSAHVIGHVGWLINSYVLLTDNFV